MLFLRAMLVALALLSLPAGAMAAEDAPLKPGIVFNASGATDQSFNATVARGTRRFTAETGIPVAEAVAVPGRAHETIQALLAGGINLLLVVGQDLGIAAEAAARENPSVRFVLFDAPVLLPNVRSVVFREHEGAFVVGVLAAMASRTKKVGFLGGRDGPLIRRFACGFAQGVRHGDPVVRVVAGVAGNDGAAWDQPDLGRTLALDQYAGGADVVFAAAGRTGLGVLAAAAETGLLAIGVDSNQNPLHPGFVLTSMLKRADIAAYLALKAAHERRWQPGLVGLGLAEDGLGWALDEHNALLITDAMFMRAEQARTAIADGSLKVHDYAADGRCPAWPEGRVPWEEGT